MTGRHKSVYFFSSLEYTKTLALQTSPMKEDTAKNVYPHWNTRGREKKGKKLLFWKTDLTGCLPLNFSSWTRTKQCGLWWEKTRTHGPLPSSSDCERPAAADPVRRRCLWTRFTCSGPSSSSLCSASFWRCVWTWWLCWVQPGSPRTISPCLCGSPAPSPRLGTRRRRLSGAASPPSDLVGTTFVLAPFGLFLQRFDVYNFLCFQL